MNIKGTRYTSIWYDKTTKKINYIDQTLLPWELKIRELRTLEDAIRAINDMEVRGAPLIGVVAAFGYYLGLKASSLRLKALGFRLEDEAEEIRNKLMSTRPTAINLKWALTQMQLSAFPDLLEKSLEIRQSEIDRSLSIGQYGLQLIKSTYALTGKPVNILTHCNAGWLACVEYGTATAPIYLAHEDGIPVHVWVDETRPRNQGAKLTAYELSQHGVPCTLIPDNTGGHLMQNGMVDMVIVGTDRVAANGDVANKIGTYLKALAAKDNEVPFYVAMPKSSFDRGTATGKGIPIEERDALEVLEMEGGMVNLGNSGNSGITKIRIAGDGVGAVNYGFDITPAGLVTGYITEDGVIDKEALAQMR